MRCSSSCSVGHRADCSDLVGVARRPLGQEVGHFPLPSQGRRWSFGKIREDYATWIEESGNLEVIMWDLDGFGTFVQLK